jgi:hypothetical protein
VEELAALLARVKLERFAAALQEEGYVFVDDLADAEDGDLAALGLKKPEVKRLRKALAGGAMSPAPPSPAAAAGPAPPSALWILAKAMP